MNRILLISGPSGSGKTSVLRRLKEKYGVKELISTTTRGRRINEIEGIDYYYISKKKFETLNLLEFTEYDGHFYGITKNEVEFAFKNNKVSALVVDWYGMKAIKQLYPERTISIYLDIDKKKALYNLINRDGEAKAINRQNYDYTKGVYNSEIKKDYDYVIINNCKNINRLTNKFAHEISLKKLFN